MGRIITFPTRIRQQRDLREKIWGEKVVDGNRRDIKLYESMNKTIYPAWKEYFNPSQAQQDTYNLKIKLQFFYLLSFIQ